MTDRSMEMLESIVVSLIRSFTEFLSVGSSGHTILLREVVQMELVPGMEVAFRLGMIAGVVLAFRSELWSMVQSTWLVVRHPFSLTTSWRENEPFRELVFVMVGTVPAAVIGTRYGAQLESWGTDLKLVSTFVIIGGFMIHLTRVFRREDPQRLTMVRALLVGIGQAMAIIPGLPRMAAAMSFGVYAGLAPETAARFSAVLALPVFVGVVLVGGPALYDVSAAAPDLLTAAAVFCSAALAGWAALRMLLGAMRSGAVRFLALYCLLIGLLGIIFL